MHYLLNRKTRSRDDIESFHFFLIIKRFQKLPFQEKGFSNERYKVLDTYYFYQHELEINNCWFRVPKDRQESDRFAVEIIAYNGAMMQAKNITDVNLKGFSGIGQCKCLWNHTIFM